MNGPFVFPVQFSVGQSDGHQAILRKVRVGPHPGGAVPGLGDVVLRLGAVEGLAKPRTAFFRARLAADLDIDSLAGILASNGDNVNPLAHCAQGLFDLIAVVFQVFDDRLGNVLLENQCHKLITFFLHSRTSDPQALPEEGPAIEELSG